MRKQKDEDTSSSLLLEKQKAKDIAISPASLKELFEGISSINPKTKFAAAKTLRTISEKNPRLLYPHMDFFVNLLESKNNILKWNAMDVIANLATVDTENKFSGLFEKFYGFLNEGSLITAGHVVDNSGKIALSKPELRGRITEKLLTVEKVPLPTSECRNILIGKTINAFSKYFDDIENKDKIISFVKRQLNNSRNATKTKAEKFLKKFIA